MRRFVAESAKTYDYVIIDTPPINTVADAQIISTYVDGVVLVTKSGVTTTDELSDAKGRRAARRREPVRRGAQRHEYEVRKIRL